VVFYGLLTGWWFEFHTCPVAAIPIRQQLQNLLFVVGQRQIDRTLSGVIAASTAARPIVSVNRSPVSATTASLTTEALELTPATAAF
jgi:hypothetical protein